MVTSWLRPYAFLKLPVLQWYLGAEWRNQPQSFFKWKLCFRTLYWNPQGSLSPSRELGTSSNCSWWMSNLSLSIVKIEGSVIYKFVRQIHWCTQNNLWTSSLESVMSSMYYEGSLRNISNIFSVTMISQSWMNKSTSIFFQLKKGPGTSYWNPLGFLISIQGVRNVLQSQEGVPDFFKK